jgi:glycosyltransferase involved in cell wall biosynthesis
MLKPKILVISSEPYLPNYNKLFSIYVLDQISLINDLNYEINFSPFSYLPIRFLFSPKKKYLFNSELINNRNIVFSGMKKQVIPIKYRKPKQVFNSLVNYGLKRFELYMKVYGKPDLIHAHNCFFAGILAMQIKKKFNVPYVLTEHSSLFYGQLSLDHISLLRDVYLNANQFTCVSEALRDRIVYYLDQKSLGEEIKILPNALDPIFEEVDIIKSNKARSLNDFVFINIGNLVEVKDQELLIRSFHKAYKNILNVKLNIIGHGLLEKKLTSLIKELGLESQVFLKGYLSKNEIIKELLASNVFVLSSKFETFGIVVVEAFACGLPVLTTPCEGPKMLISDINGLMVEYHTIEALSEGLLYMSKNISRYNSTLIKKECLDKFGQTGFKKNINNIYEKILNN